MEKQLIRYIPEPDLSVIVQQVNSQVVYVIGKVNPPPATFRLIATSMCCRPYPMAGGLNIFADKKDIRIFRKTDNQTLVIPFNYQAVTEENRLEENILLQREDVVVVK